MEYLQLDKTKIAIQKIVDMPNQLIDLLIKFVIQNNGKLSESKRQKFFALLTDDEIKQIVAAVNDFSAFFTVI